MIVSENLLPPKFRYLRRRVLLKYTGHSARAQLSDSSEDRCVSDCSNSAEDTRPVAGRGASCPVETTEFFFCIAFRCVNCYDSYTNIKIYSKLTPAPVYKKSWQCTIICPIELLVWAVWEQVVITQCYHDHPFPIPTFSCLTWFCCKPAVSGLQWHSRTDRFLARALNSTTHSPWPSLIQSLW